MHTHAPAHSPAHAFVVIIDIFRIAKIVKNRRNGIKWHAENGVLCRVVAICSFAYSDYTQLPRLPFFFLRSFAGAGAAAVLAVVVAVAAVAGLFIWMSRHAFLLCIDVCKLGPCLMHTVVQPRCVCRRVVLFLWRSNFVPGCVQRMAK